MIAEITTEAPAERRPSRREKLSLADPTRLDRLPPHDLAAEAGVLGCILLDAGGGNVDCADDAIEALTVPIAFYDHRHQHVFAAILRCRAEKKTPDTIVLMQLLSQAGELENCGGIAYLSSLPDAVPSAANLAHYLEIVWEKFLLRRQIAACTAAVARCYEAESEETVQDILAENERAVMQASEVRLRNSEKNAKEVIMDVSENILEKYRRGVKFNIGPATGFNYLDNILPGLGKGQLIVEAARPRTGKSAKMMQTAEYIAMVEKLPVAIFSLEMTARSLLLRELFQNAGSDLTKFLNGFLTEADLAPLVSSAGKLAGLEKLLFIDESARMSIEDLEVRARRMKRKHGIQVFFIDYFQLLYCRNAKRQWSKSDELAECSMRLKGLAKELDVPIVLCAQMNREIEKDTHRRPRLSDLRDTGQLEQDADVIMFLWKPDTSAEMWQQKIEQILQRVPCPAEWRTVERNEDGKTWKHYLSLVNCTVEKQREGRSGEDALMVFIKPWTRFVDAYRPPKEKKVKQSEIEEHENQ